MLEEEISLVHLLNLTDALPCKVSPAHALPQSGYLPAEAASDNGGDAAWHRSRATVAAHAPSGWPLGGSGAVNDSTHSSSQGALAKVGMEGRGSSRRGRLATEMFGEARKDGAVQRRHALAMSHTGALFAIHVFPAVVALHHPSQCAGMSHW
jgi:hypothetical protein